MSRRRILVPVDFSEHSRGALHYALELGRRLGCDVEAVAIWQPTDDLPDELSLERLRERLRRLLNEVEGGGAGPVTARLEHGDPAERIVKLSESGSCGMIVMGMESSALPGGTIVGTVEQVLTKSSVPVVTVASIRPAARTSDSGPPADSAH